jgi:hypothetical protein
MKGIIFCPLCFDAETDAARLSRRSVVFDNFTFKVANASTGQLLQHLQRKHAALVKERNSAEAAKHKGSLDDFLKISSSYESAALKWAVQTYQPLDTFDHESFRDMVHQLNPKTKHLNSQWMRQKVTLAAAFVREHVAKAVSNQWVAFALDEWTSITQESFLGVTAHFIDADWKLRTLCLSCSPTESEHSRAEDVVEEFYKVVRDNCGEGCRIGAVVSDTDAAMNKFGILMEQRGVEWVGCIDHVLELCTGVVLNDQASAGLLKFARGIIGSIKHSSIKTARLIEVQKLENVRRPKGVIEDVRTRWWSTYSMVQRLVDLRPYI